MTNYIPQTSASDPVALVVVATVLAVAGIALAWKGRAR